MILLAAAIFGVSLTENSVYAQAVGSVAGAERNLFINPGFESGSVGWLEKSSGGFKLIGQYHNSSNPNNWSAYLCGYQNCRESIYQDVTIPLDAPGPVYITFDYHIDVFDPTGIFANIPFNKLAVHLLIPPTSSSWPDRCLELWNTDATPGWAKYKWNGCALWVEQGQTVRIEFVAETNDLMSTGFYIDNIALMVPGVPPSTAAPVIEFYNTNLDNYFITADSNEAAQIDGGSAGPGWMRTGNSFKSGGSNSVCRFYGSQSPGPNSHFYTVDSAECQGLKDQQIPTGDTRKLTVKSWNFESLDFASTSLTNGTCPTGTTPVYRAYNNGFTRGVDSNHRITSSLTAIQEVVARGWNNEGVVMCAPN